MLSRGTTNDLSYDRRRRNMHTQKEQTPSKRDRTTRRKHEDRTRQGRERRTESKMLAALLSLLRFMASRGKKEQANKEQEKKKPPPRTPTPHKGRTHTQRRTHARPDRQDRQDRQHSSTSKCRRGDGSMAH